MYDVDVVGQVVICLTRVKAGRIRNKQESAKINHRKQFS